ncbi:MAG TPA: ATP-binding cassette domain-containing protein [Elusimicrobiota bacterium]|nr:ATP-binding cassette domain-containing protein [Elusimicrobiota bacterium]
MNESAHIRFEGADLGYNKTAVLKDVTCRIGQGEVIGMVGPNGSGKTTFLRTLLGLVPPLGGTVKVDRSRRFAYVPQLEEVNLFWPLTVRETVCLAQRSKRAFGRVSEEECARVDNAMRKVGISPIADMLFRETSGGQRQKTMLAQALSQEPDVLLLDEPTRGLDVVAERDFLKIVEGLRSKKLTLFIVSHTLHIPLNYTEKILLFHAGRVVEATPDELLSTKVLDTIYGVPFFHHNDSGIRWAGPKRGGE